MSSANARSAGRFTGDYPHRHEPDVAASPMASTAWPRPVTRDKPAPDARAQAEHLRVCAWRNHHASGQATRCPASASFQRISATGTASSSHRIVMQFDNNAASIAADRQGRAASCDQHPIIGGQTRRHRRQAIGHAGPALPRHKTGRSLLPMCRRPVKARQSIHRQQKAPPTLPLDLRTTASAASA